MGKQVYTFDDVHRHPFLPEGPSVVDCSTTRYMGVRFQLRRKARLFFEKVNWNVVWRHEAVEGLVDEHSHQEIYWEGQRQHLMLEFRSISRERAREWRKDGVVTVQVRVMGRLLVENAFELTGCDNPGEESAT